MKCIAFMMYTLVSRPRSDEGFKVLSAIITTIGDDNAGRLNNGLKKARQGFHKHKLPTGRVNHGHLTLVEERSSLTNCSSTSPRWTWRRAQTNRKKNT